MKFKNIKLPRIPQLNMCLSQDINLACPTDGQTDLFICNPVDMSLLPHQPINFISSPTLCFYHLSCCTLKISSLLLGPNLVHLSRPSFKCYHSYSTVGSLPPGINLLLFTSFYIYLISFLGLPTFPLM